MLETGPNVGWAGQLLSTRLTNDARTGIFAAARLLFKRIRPLETERLRVEKFLEIDLGGETEKIGQCGA